MALQLDKTHLILTSICVVLVGILFYGGLQYVANIDKAKSDAITLQLQTTQSQLQTERTTFAAQLSAANARDAQRAQAIKSRDDSTSRAKVVDSTASAQEIASRISTLANVPTPDVAGDSISLPLNTARVVAQDLESVAPLTEDVKDLNATLQDKEAIITAQSSIITTEEKEITQLNAKYEQDTRTLKASARKSKLKWFAAGLVTGLTLGLVK